MSATITNAFVQQFDTTIQLLSQQQESRFQSCVIDRGNITGESFTANLLGAADEIDANTVRHGDTVWSEIEHSTRVALMQDFIKHYPVDRADVAKLLANPVGPYTQRLMAAKNLRIDKMIYDALRGASTAKDGTSVALPSGQKIAVGGTGFTKAKIIKAKSLFRENEADEHNGEDLYIAYNSVMLEDILSDTTLTSADFMAVQMLQSGNLAGSWCGFKWVPYERLTKVSTDYYTVAWAKSALQFGTGYTEGRVDTRADKNYTMQVSMAASFGTTRVDEKKVVEIAFA